MGHRVQARRAVLLLLFLAVSCAAAAAAESQAAQKAFGSLFGADLKRVQGTDDPSDDVDLAGQILDAAQAVPDRAALVEVFCDQATRLVGAHPAGYATVARAMNLLAAYVPAREADARGRLLEIRQKQFDAAKGEERKVAGEGLLDALLETAYAREWADDLAEARRLLGQAKTVASTIESPRLPSIGQHAEDLDHRARTARRIADLQTRLEKEPGNVSAREELVRLYVVERNDPGKAAAVLGAGEVQDKALKRCVPAAAKPMAETSERICLELGQWYHGLAEASAASTKPAIHARARAYLERFLLLHTAQDEGRVLAKEALGKVEGALAELHGAAPAEGAARPGVIGPGWWVNLLPLVDAAKDAVHGTWQRQDSGLAITSPLLAGRIVLPVAPEGGYELHVRFVRLTGDDTVAVFLPARRERSILMLSHRHGELSVLDLGGVDEPRVRPARLVNGREYSLRIKVLLEGGQADIAVILDGKPYMNWHGLASALSVHHSWRLPQAGCLGLGVNNSHVVFRSVRLRILSGNARLLRVKEASENAGGAEVGTKPVGSVLDVLAAVDPDRDVLEGGWDRADGGLRLNGPSQGAKVMAPVEVQGGFLLEATLTRTEGNDTVGIVLPVGDRQVLLGLGYYGNICHGLDQIRGKPGHQNETTLDSGRLENGRRYHVRATVVVWPGKVRIVAWLDGEAIIDWSGEAQHLTMYRGWRIPAQHRIGFGASNSKVLWERMTVQALSGGEVRRIR